MARDYGRVHTAFWNSRDIRELSDRGKLLANYLITGPHSNMLGAYLLPDAYITDDLNWTLETVRRTLSELFDNGFATRFSDGRHIVICKFLHWNPIENPNVAKAAVKLLDQLPRDEALDHVFNGLALYEKHFPNGIETLRERFAKPFRNQEQEPEPSPEPEPTLSPRALRAEFEEGFWPVCAKKVGKEAAFKAFSKAHKTTSAETIVNAMRQYAASRAGQEAQYTAHPAKWLNDGRWADESAPLSNGEIKFDYSAFHSPEELEAQRRRKEAELHG